MKMILKYCWLNIHSEKKIERVAGKNRFICSNGRKVPFKVSRIYMN